MAQAYQCALPQRAGRSLVIGNACLPIDGDGICYGVPPEHCAWFDAQPAAWLPVEGQQSNPDAPPSCAAPAEEAAVQVPKPPPQRSKKKRGHHR